MISAEELYGEIWANDRGLEDELRQSLDPRGSSSLFSAFAALGPEPGQLVVDVGCRDARHAVELAARFQLRVLAVDPVALHVKQARERVSEAAVKELVKVAQAGIESLPLADGAAAFIWCRDVTTHVDLSRGLAECRRVLEPGGRMLVYQTFETELMAPHEAASLYAATASVPENMDRGRFERLASEVGLTIDSVDTLGGEWRESMVEEGKWSASDALLAVSRLRRRETELTERYGRHQVDAAYANNVWGVYQLLGKLCPVVYVLRRGD